MYSKQLKKDLRNNKLTISLSLVLALFLNSSCKFSTANNVTQAVFNPIIDIALEASILKNRIHIDEFADSPFIFN